MTQKAKNRRLTESAMMIALATVLSFVQFAAPWANGGSITLFSMVPIALVAYKYGVTWGIFTGMTHGLLQMLIGIGGLRGIDLTTFIAAVFLDYIIAFGALGLAGITKNSKNPSALGFAAGAFIGGLGRFVCHFLSGFLLWGSIANDGFAAVAFSFTYNVSYMGPEIFITTLGAVLCAPILKSAMAKTQLA